MQHETTFVLNSIMQATQYLTIHTYQARESITHDMLRGLHNVESMEIRKSVIELFALTPSSKIDDTETHSDYFPPIPPVVYNIVRLFTIHCELSHKVVFYYFLMFRGHFYNCSNIRLHFIWFRTL